MTEVSFLDELHQQVQMLAGESDSERSWAGAFTELVLESLTDIGEIQDPIAAAFEGSHGRGQAAASGFAVRGDSEVLDVFLAIYDGGATAVTLRKTDIDGALKRLHRFVAACAEGIHEELEESSEAYDMAQRIHKLLFEVAFVRLFVITDAIVKSQPSALPSVAGLPVSALVWDLERLERLATSGRESEPIVVDMLAFNGAPLPFLGPEGEPDDYQGYLLLLDGEVLADIYAEFGPRLLELNVRSFLQARGKVNRGIQETIKSAPHRFLAYNNGVSMTASRVEFTTDDRGRRGIATIHDLQIVNGGQTTASLFHAATKAKASLSEVRVQAKLSVVSPDRLQEVVPLISQFANSQNAVKTADFSANHPFHVRLEELSRKMWAPAVGGGPLMTRWFYERARGQYMDALGRAGSPANQRQFKQRHPLGQKFVKTDVAKFENTWAQLPHLVALGADKNFSHYMLRVDGGQSTQLPERAFFEHLVAKAILFRSSEKLIGGLQLGGYRSQTVTYTLALLSRRVGSHVDLDLIWRLQELPEEISRMVLELAPEVHAELIRSAGRANVSEHAKKPACWEAIQRLGGSLSGWAAENSHVQRSGGVIDIYAVYDDERIEAEFDPSNRTVLITSGFLEGWQYNTPSGAASAVVRRYRPNVDPNRNGWLFWLVAATGETLQSVRQ